MTRAKRHNPYIGTFADLRREMVARGLATPKNVETRARAYVRECDCETLILDRLDGRGPVEMIARRAKRKAGS
jgi:hypothetical protein